MTLHYIVTLLQVNFGTFDFMHLYDLYRWTFVHAMNNNGAYWSEFVNILGIQHHELLYIIDKYNDGKVFVSVASCILGTVKVSDSLIVLFFLFYLLLCIISAFVVFLFGTRCIYLLLLLLLSL